MKLISEFEVLIANFKNISERLWFKQFPFKRYIELTLHVKALQKFISIDFAYSENSSFELLIKIFKISLY